MQFGLIDKVVSEKKMFENYCHIHVFSSGGMSRRPTQWGQFLYIDKKHALWHAIFRPENKQIALHSKRYRYCWLGINL